MEAQRVAVKSNILYDALAVPSLGAEFKIGEKMTFDLSGQFCGWDVGSHKWKQWAVQPELRYWPCRSFTGHFFGLHLLGGQYNFGNINLPFSFLGTNFRALKDHRRQGWMAGAGVAYGYTWILSRRWSCEAEVGLGWLYTKYDVYECRDCGMKMRKGIAHNYVGLTKAALNIIYNF